MQDWLSNAKSSSHGGFGVGFRFPATKQEIIDEGRRQHLPPEMIARLEKLPDKRYENVADLVASSTG